MARPLVEELFFCGFPYYELGYKHRLFLQMSKERLALFFFVEPPAATPHPIDLSGFLQLANGLK